MQAFLLQGGIITPDRTFISLDSNVRSARSITVVVNQMRYKNRSLNQGEAMFQLQFTWDAWIQPDQKSNPTVLRRELEKFISSAETAMFNGNDEQSPLIVTADNITLAGRALAVDPSNGQKPDLAQSALDNEDMKNFRMDWLLTAEIYETRGYTENVRGEFFWTENLNFVAAVSGSALPS